MKAIFAYVLFTLLAGSATAQIPQTGIYDGGASVNIVRDEKAKTVTCTFITCVQQGKICCSFNLIAHYKTLQDKKLQFRTQWPDNHDDEQTGTLFCNGKSVSIKLDAEPPGSMACSDIVEGTGYEVTLSEVRSWLGLRMIKSRKAYFHDAPGDATARKAYVTLYDVIGVLETKPGWVKAEFAADNSKHTTTTGWIKEADIFPSL